MNNDKNKAYICLTTTVEQNLYERLVKETIDALSAKPHTHGISFSQQSTMIMGIIRRIAIEFQAAGYHVTTNSMESGAIYIRLP